MTQFLICFGLMGFVGIPVVLFFALCGVDKAHKLGGSAITLAFWLLISGAIVLGSKMDFYTYNNGVCIVCEGEYKFSGATQYRNSHHYYYTCENCDHTIKTNSLMK